jgi:ActR/RegA family two-component response regulator
MVLAVAPPKQLETWEPALRARGLEVLRASGHAEALSELRRSNAAAVVVSERLPWNGALRVARAVRADSGLAGVPVVVVGYPELTTAQRLRLRGGAPDASVPMKASPDEVAAAVQAAVERGPLPPVVLTPEQERALKVSRVAMLLMLFGVIFSFPTRSPTAAAQIWWILLVPLGGLLSDWATGRVDGRARLLSWQGWAAIVLGVAIAVAIPLFPGWFGPLPLPGR